MRRCLINLTRFGDLLQTQPVIRAFREQGDEVSLICLENFAPAAELLDGLEQVLPIHLDEEEMIQLRASAKAISDAIQILYEEP